MSVTPKQKPCFNCSIFAINQMNVKTICWNTMLINDHYIISSMKPYYGKPTTMSKKYAVLPGNRKEELKCRRLIQFFPALPLALQHPLQLHTFERNPALAVVGGQASHPPPAPTPFPKTSHCHSLLQTVWNYGKKCYKLVQRDGMGLLEYRLLEYKWNFARSWNKQEIASLVYRLPCQAARHSLHSFHQCTDQVPALHFQSNWTRRR